MSTKTKVIATVLVFTIVGFMLNPNAPLGAAVFGAPPAGDGPGPTGGQIGALMVVALIESIAFGLGVAFLAFGLAVVRRVVPRAGLAGSVHLAIVWFLVSWVPHTALHQTAGNNFAKLVLIEYAFHVTLVVAGTVVAWALVATSRERAATGAARRDASRSSDA